MRGRLSWKPAGARSRYATPAAPALVIVGLCALTLYRGLASYPGANLRNRPEDTGLAPGQAILADNPPAGTAVLGTLPEELALNYLTGVWGMRPDVHAVSADQARVLFAGGKSTLAVTGAALPLVSREIDPQAHYSALGRTLVAISAAPPTTTLAGLPPWNEDFGDGLRLAGGRASRNPATGETIVLLSWSVMSRPARDLSVSVRLTQNGAEIGQVDRQDPVAGAYPTTRWSPGETVGDAYPFSLPAGAAPDGVSVIVYYRDVSGQYVNLHAAHFPLSVIQQGTGAARPATAAGG